MADAVAAISGRHPDRRRLEQFGRGGLTLEESRDVMRHLLAGCPDCLQVTRRLLPALPGSPASSSSPAYDYRKAFERSARELVDRQIALATEAAEAGELRREVDERTAVPQWRRITEDARFHTWSVCDLLLDESCRVGREDARRAMDLAELGAMVASRLAAGTYGEGRIADLTGRAWATLADAERLLGDLQAAEQSFVRAEKELRRGTGDPLEKARVLLRKAALRSDQGRRREALGLIERAAGLAERGGDSALAGQAWWAHGLAASGPSTPAPLFLVLSHGRSAARTFFTALAGRLAALRGLRRSAL